MARGNAIRYQGKIATWKDDQGFGFIAPNGGGPLVFVHIKSFANRGNRPASDDVVTYQLTVNDKGQPRAESVAFVRERGSPSPSSANKASTSLLLLAVGFLGAVATLVFLGKLPPTVLWADLGLSVVTFIAYALDKWAARADRWRTKESTLHMLGLAGGWPGALVAQQVLRHKSKKQSFQTAFWFTVAVNCAGLGWLLSTSGAALLLTIFDEFN
jgi:uncharacterized membrane protein YsdA (DUF1294 family)/cold shock CspA family protein